jgi:hypothetical protein
METEEPDVISLEIKEPDKLLLTADECLDFMDFTEKCNVGKGYFTAEERMEVFQHTIAYNPSYTLIEHKANFGTLIKEFKTNKINGERMGNSGEWDRLGNNQELERIGNTGEAETANTYNNIKNSFETDEHAKLKLVCSKRRSKKKQKDNNTTSYNKSKTDKVDLRANHNLKRDSPSSIVCPLASKCCDRENHKERTNHKVCPMKNLYLMHKGRCYHIIQCEWKYAPGFE